jgi:hypothetical protein
LQARHFFWHSQHVPVLEKPLWSFCGVSYVLDSVTSASARNGRA